MDPQAERRRHPRRKTPVTIEIPMMSDAPLDAGDVSARGIRLVVPHRPERAGEMECEIRFGEAVFRRVRARIVWVSPAEDGTSAWNAGLEILATDRKARDFQLFLEEMFREP